MWRMRDPYFDDFDPFGSGFGGFGGFGGFDDVDRRGFAPVSQRAQNAREQAMTLFLEHLATVDTSAGPVTAEIVQFHMVPDMRKSFAKMVKEHHCTATSRQLTRAEQDKINANRKSLMWYTSVTVTPDAQKAYLEKNPGVVEKIKKKREAALAAKSASKKPALGQAQPVASGSASKKRTATQANLAATSSTAKKAKA